MIRFIAIAIAMAALILFTIFVVLPVLLFFLSLILAVPIGALETLF